MKDASTLNRERMTSALRVCREYMGSDSSKAHLALLESLLEHYQLELEDVTANGLPRVQGALRQVRALIDSLTADVGELPRI